MEKEAIISSETEKEIEESSENENFKKVEAALFLSARFLSLEELVMLTDINPLMIREIVSKLIEKYNKEESAIEIIAKKDMWKMDVRQEYVYMVNKLATGSSEFTKAEQETLAVIAYKQPVKQSVVINIRGNKAYEHIKHFREIGLVFAKKAGHTIDLKLSDDFFDYFHLQNRGDKAILDDHSDSEYTEESEETASSLSDDNEEIGKKEETASSLSDDNEETGKIIAVESKDEDGNEGENEEEVDEEVKGGGE